MFILGHIGFSFAALYWLKRRAKDMDYRLLLLGSMLPDIIDKPLGLVAFADTVYNGRIIAHTAVFAFVITVISIRMKSAKLKMLSMGIWLHLLLDFMFLYPATLLWPLFGGFKPLAYHPDFTAELVSNPFVYTTEAIGLAFLLHIFAKHGLYKRENFMRFIKTGKLG